MEKGTRDLGRKRGRGAEPLGAGSSAQPSGCLDGAGRVCPAQRRSQSPWWRKKVVEMGGETFSFSCSEIFLAHLFCSFFMSLTRTKKGFSYLVQWARDTGMEKCSSGAGYLQIAEPGTLF